MLLCVAGGSGTEFTRDRPRAASRCSSQSFLIKNNANQQVMVEERCSMTSSAVPTDQVTARATLSLHLRTNHKVPSKSQTCSKEPSVAYRSRVIVVSGEDSVPSEKAETCSTTTTFKSNVVNGKRGTNTILVRYKPSKPVSAESDDELQFEFYPRHDGVSAISSSPPSTISSDSSSGKKDKPSTSAWAQIMELEGYRSPAIGLDNCPSKQNDKFFSVLESDSISNFSSLSGESHRSNLSGDPNLCNNRFPKHSVNLYDCEQFEFPAEAAVCSEKQHFGDNVSKCDNVSLSKPPRLKESSQIGRAVAYDVTNQSLSDFTVSLDDCPQIQSVKAKCLVPYRYGDNVANDFPCHDNSERNQFNGTQAAPKFKSSMLRSESSRMSKIHPPDRNKSRRKTLPDGNLSLHNTNSKALSSRDSLEKNQKSPEHDPNASWGRYNSRAMRDSVRKVAEKYAETVYLRRQTLSKLDSLPESKGIQLTRYVSPFNEHEHVHSSKQILHLPKNLYCSKRANSTSHLHEMPCETESAIANRSRLHIKMPITTHHNHRIVHVTSAAKRIQLPHELKVCDLNQKREMESLDFSDSTLGNTVDLDSLSSSSDNRTNQTNDKCIERTEISFYSDKDEIRLNGKCRTSDDNRVSKDDRNQTILSHATVYQAPHSLKSKSLEKNLPSIECQISSNGTKDPLHLSIRMQDIKTKLCADCAQSTELGPPSKQSACRAKHQSSETYSNAVMSPQISLLKRAPLVICEGDSNPSLYIRPLQSKQNGSPLSPENNPRKCTMLTAREMAELVQGTGSDRLGDAKLNHASVTSKVSSWIQKQKDKRKPVFFIGDTPSFFVENSIESQLDSSSKNASRKSRRSLSLSSVREGEVSTNCIGLADKAFNSSELRLKSENPEDSSLKHEHKSLFIKRASSTCSNRGSIRRKGRQGSPAREEKELIKSSIYNRNQVDGCIASWSNKLHNKIRNSCHETVHSNNSVGNSEFQISEQTENGLCSQDVAQDGNDESFLDRSSGPFIEHQRSVKSFKTHGENVFANSKLQIQTEKSVLACGETLISPLLESHDSRNSYTIVSSSSQNVDIADLDKPERSALSRKLLNFKQITRALSLHSLKKKTKELPVQTSMAAKESANLESVTSTYLSKWTRGSKRRIENLKYGSLRKSVSYCELTARSAKVSGKLHHSPVKLLPEVKTKVSVKKPPAKTCIPSRTSTCSCSSSLRRSVSLFWQFPFSKNQDYTVEIKNDILAKICFSRLHRRNTILPFLRDIKHKRTKVSNFAEHSDNRHLNDESEESLGNIWNKEPVLNQPGSLKHTIVTESDVQQSALNGDKETSQKSSIIMGLGSNYVLNEINNSSNLSILEEYLPIDHSLDNKLKSESPVSMNKSKTPIVLRLQTKTTSRSERYSKGKSTSDIFGRNGIKSTTGNSETKKRPSSQFYDIEEFDLKAENEPNLGQLSSIVSSSQPALCEIDQLSSIPQSSGLASKHLPQHTSTPHLSPAEGLLRRFRKSFAVRFKKKSEVTTGSSIVETPKSSLKAFPGPVLNSITPTDDTNKDEKFTILKSCSPIAASDKSETIISDIQDCKKISPKSHQSELHRTFSNDKKRNKKKTDWRSSLFYDSVDSIFETSFKSGVDKCRLPHFAGSDANILRKRAACTSDYSPKSKAVQRPVSIVDSLTLENSNCTKVPDGKQDVSRTASDTPSSAEQQKNLTSLDQIWRANPVKLCRVHSRLLMCRHKGRYRLRRSISEPVELEMTGSIHNLRESTHGSADQDSFQKGSLSSEDEASSESDIYHSYCCSPTRRSNTCWELSGDGNMYAEALWDHETLDTEELPFQAGDIIEVTDTSDQDWWWGTKDGQGGWFPSAFVRLYVSHRGPTLHFNGQQSDGIQIPYSPCKASMNNLSCEQVRANIVREIVATERDYVKHLKDVVEGYLKQVHRRPDMFSKERIETVFGNIKEIYSFQSQFLTQLEECLDKDSPHLSQIGNSFLNHKEEFKMYSQYCNNHPLAVSELQELYCDSQYIHFFEACRLLQEMIDISLDGFLLTPIQRICKYPLQLAELLKFTDVNHPDHVPVSNALAAMKEVAELVNERKRRMECLERIAEWQSTIEGWEGPDVLDTSSILIHCGEVTRVSSSWSRDIYLFIFDHQLIYCKKDLLKRHTYAYKGRLNLDHCDILDVEDGKDSQFAVNVKNAWKIYCKDKDKWYLFYAKTSPEKDQWLRAFKAERLRVSDDEKQAFVVTEEAKRSARLAVHNKQKPKRPRAKFTKGRRCHPDVAVTELLLDSPSAKARSGSLPSNIHPELAIMAGAKLGPTRKKGSGWFHFGSGKKPKS